MPPLLSRIALSSLVFLSVACAAALPDPSAIVAAERAFAADGYANGIKKSFLAYAAEDGVFFAPGPVNAHATLNEAPDEDLTEPRRHLVWWPLYAGIAGSGDLGFTTGPYAFDADRRGHYFTIWRKEADGTWKWLLDAGVAADAAGEAEQGADVLFLPTARAKSASPQAAMTEVAALETAIAEKAAGSVQSAYEPFLAGDSRLHSAGPPPAKDASGRSAIFAARPAQIRFSPIGGGASRAGDFVWTYGEGTWSENNVDKTGWYVRVWQKRPEGWRLAFDEFLPPPEPRPTEQ